MDASPPINLTLFFTRSNSLATWENAGMLERETALYRRLRPRLNGVTFVTYGGRSERRYLDGLDGIAVHCNQWRLPFRLYAWSLRRLWSPPPGAVIKSNQVQGSEIALAAARRTGRPFVARCGYLLSDFMIRAHGPDSPQAAEARDLERHVFSQADRVVVTTRDMAGQITRDYGLAPERVRVIPNYVDADLFTPEPRGGARPGRLLFVGRLAEQKNPLALLEALPGLEAELLMAGDGPLAERLRGRAAELNVKVRFLGPTPHADLPGLMRGAQAFVLPSLYEGHPKALLEAMACGLPVIAGRSPGISDLISHGENGWLCGTSPAEIRQALETVLGDAELRDRLGLGAARFVANNFSLERIVDMELELYRELVS